MVPFSWIGRRQRSYRRSEYGVHDGFRPAPMLRLSFCVKPLGTGFEPSLTAGCDVCTRANFEPELNSATFTDFVSIEEWQGIFH